MSMRYIKQIITLVVAVVVTSCISDDENGFTKGSNRGDYIEVCARIANYDDCNVGSRSAKTNEEAKVTSMALALFPIENNTIARCIHYEYESGANVSFTIDRKDEKFDGYDNTHFVMYIFANVANDTEKMGVDKTLENFKSHVEGTQAAWYANTNGVGLPDTGFPMVGSLGDASADGKTFILKPTVTTNNPHALPLVNGTPSDLLNIPMEVMYAKFSFTITLNPTQSQSGNTQSFTMSKYTLHNIPSSVDFDSSTNSDTGVLDASFDVAVNSTVLEGSNAEGNEGRGAITFSFYVPERLLEPTTSAENYGYPFKQGGVIRDEDLDLRQRYKPLLIDSVDKKATYVTIEGEYIDHNRHSWNVAYDIYLGSDNYSNFDIERNINYINSVEIRGITSSKDQAITQGAISIDHRVTITRSNPIIVNLRRETLLDSHFEVRPLRIRAKEGTAGKSVTVSINPVEGDVTPNWIRLEHKNDGTAKNGYNDYLSNGKRKYFTYGLITGNAFGGGREENNLSGSTSVTFNSRTENDCVWIYVDECTETYGLNTDGSVNVAPRTAKIVISVAGEDTELEYIINQDKLYPIYNSGSTQPDYLIESYEEYLYNYDAEDTYSANKTFFEGMVWGLDSNQLSNKHIAADPSQAELNNYNRLSDSQKNTIQERVKSYYDFYNVKHDSDINTPEAKHTRAGYHFCNEIIVTANIDDEIAGLTLDKQPASAVEYCYNRNKRNRDGTVASTDWYLPAIDEIEDIMVNAYNAFDGVFQSQDYWSCQPSYHRCYFFMSQSFGGIFSKYTVAGNFDFYIDDTRRARSTKATFKGYEGNIAKFDYNPSGIMIPTVTQETRVGNSNANVNFKIQKGYYKWMTNRGGNYVDGTAPNIIESYSDGEGGIQTNYSTNPPSDNYDHKNAYVTGTNVWPEFGEAPYRQDGNRFRTEMNRVRCLRKLP